jgi:uncharacterized lipoprotein YmbA
MASLLAAICPILSLVGCGSAGPPPTTYVLETPASRPNRLLVEPLTGKPVLELKPVLVPDYLDGLDILVRDGTNTLVPLATARWAERLSVGVTRALAQALSARLPGFVVTTVDPIEPPSRRLLVEIESFESGPDGSVVLVARWRVLDDRGRRTLAGQQLTVAEPVSRLDAQQIVPAMTRAVEVLAARVAEGIRGTASGARRPG